MKLSCAPHSFLIFTLTLVVSIVCFMFCAHGAAGQPGLKTVNVHGIVMDEYSGMVLPGAKVFLIGYSTGSILADENGIFSFEGIREGEYTLMVRLVGYMDSTRDIQVTGHHIVENFKLNQISGTVSGRVISRMFNSPISGAKISITGLDVPTATDGEGNFVIRNVPVSGESYLMKISSVGFHEADLSFKVRTPGDISLEAIDLFPNTVVLSGQVSDKKTMKPIRDATIMVEGVFGQGRTYDNGKYEIYEIPSELEKLRITVVAPGYEPLHEIFTPDMEKFRQVLNFALDRVGSFE